MEKKFNFIDMTGWIMKEHGVPKSRLTIIELVEPYISPADGHKRQRWRCRCECGNEIVAIANAIRKGRILSCGCYHSDCAKQVIRKAIESNKTHGESTERLYKIWAAMKVRCYLETDQHYPIYGARGIKVCDEWRDSYEAFRDWALQNGYDKNLTIDRIDVNGNYEPSNCRWATAKEQSNNTRRNFIITYNGKTQTLQQWAEEIGINPTTLRYRLCKFNYTIEDALTLPVGCFRDRKRKNP